MALAGIPLFTGPQDPSQLDALLNQVIVAANGAITGSSPTGSQLTAGTTAANLPTFGVVTLSSTVANAAYTLPGPTNAQLGQMVELVAISTKSQTVALKYNTTKTKLTFVSTAALATAQRLPAVTLFAASTTRGWVATGMVGSVKST